MKRIIPSYFQICIRIALNSIGELPKFRHYSNCVCEQGLYLSWHII